MVTLRRRTALAGAAALASAPILTTLVSQSARAFDRTGAHSGVGCALLLGLGIPGLSTAPIVQQGADGAAKAAGASPPSPGIVSGLQQAVDRAGDCELFPLFCNPAIEPVSINFITDMSSQPLELSSSDEQIVRQDPAAYMQDNLDVVGGYLRRFGTGPNAGFQTVVVSGASFTAVGSIPAFVPWPVFLNLKPSAKGFYATGISFGQAIDETSLLSLFAFLG